MPTATPQYYKNTLQPLQINQSTLQQTLKELQRAVIQGTKVLQAGSPAPVSSTDHSGIYSGTAGAHCTFTPLNTIIDKTTGIVLAFLRLERHKDVLGETKLPDFRKPCEREDHSCWRCETSTSGIHVARGVVTRTTCRASLGRP